MRISKDCYSALFSDTDSQIRPDILVRQPHLDYNDCRDDTDTLLDASVANPGV